MTEEHGDLLILRGISGSGKSTFTELLREKYPRLVTCSADQYMVDGEGNYEFDHTRLGACHTACFSKAIESLRKGEATVVIDNMNTQLWEMSPYLMLGSAYAYRTHLVYLEVPVEVAAARNLHGVPAESVAQMAKRFASPLRYWPKQKKFTNPTANEVHEWASQYFVEV